MSVCWCIKCGAMVGGYEKYCANCTHKYGVKNDFNFWKKQADVTVTWNNRELIFKQDMQNNMHFNVSPDVKPETIDALTTAMIMAVEKMPQKKKRKRSHAKHNDSVL